MTDFSKENKERMIEALMVLLGMPVDDVTSETDITLNARVSARRPARRAGYRRQLRDAALSLYETGGLAPEVEVRYRLGEQEVQRLVGRMAWIMARTTGSWDQKYMIVGPDDDKTCEVCRGWVGRIVTLNPGGEDSIDNFIMNHGFHPHCRHGIQIVNEED